MSEWSAWALSMCEFYFKGTLALHLQMFRWNSFHETKRIGIYSLQIFPFFFLFLSIACFARHSWAEIFHNRICQKGSLKTRMISDFHRISRLWILSVTIGSESIFETSILSVRISLFPRTSISTVRTFHTQIHRCEIVRFRSTRSAHLMSTCDVHLYRNRESDRMRPSSQFLSLFTFSNFHTHTNELCVYTLHTRLVPSDRAVPNVAEQIVVSAVV